MPDKRDLDNLWTIRQLLEQALAKAEDLPKKELGSIITVMIKLLLSFVKSKIQGVRNAI